MLPRTGEDAAVGTAEGWHEALPPIDIGDQWAVHPVSALA